MIPPQTFIELQGGHKIINCPNCQRLIYWVEHFNEGPTRRLMKWRTTPNSF